MATKPVSAFTQQHFDYAATKAMYDEYFVPLYSKLRTTKPVSRHNVCALIQKILTGLKSDYEVIKKDGVNILILKRTSHLDPYIQVLGIEDCFDVLLDAHLQTNHGGRIKMTALIEPKYRVPRQCLTRFSIVCNVCTGYPRPWIRPSKKKIEGKKNALSDLGKPSQQLLKALLEVNIEKKNASSNLGKPVQVPLIPISEVNIISMDQCDGSFKYLLIFMDSITNYLILRPLLQLNAIEVAIELLKIFTDFEVPREIDVYRRNFMFFNEVIHEIKKTLPDYDIVLAKLSPTFTSRVTGNTVIEMLNDWMHNTNSTSWGIGCHMVQWKLNNTAFSRNNERVTPYMAFFGKSPRNIDVTDTKNNVMLIGEESIEKSYVKVDRGLKKINLDAQKPTKKAYCNLFVTDTESHMSADAVMSGMRPDKTFLYSLGESNVVGAEKLTIKPEVLEGDDVNQNTTDSDTKLLFEFKGNEIFLTPTIVEGSTCTLATGKGF